MYIFQISYVYLQKFNYVQCHNNIICMSGLQHSGYGRDIRIDKRVHYVRQPCSPDNISP